MLPAYMARPLFLSGVVTLVGSIVLLGQGNFWGGFAGIASGTLMFLGASRATAAREGQRLPGGEGASRQPVVIAGVAVTAMFALLVWTNGPQVEFALLAVFVFSLGALAYWRHK